MKASEKFWKGKASAERNLEGKINHAWSPHNWGR
jgi:hypothetical protein